jgi:arylsulfatase A-like enzyme
MPSSWRPNVIIILTDDQGYNDLSIQGSRNIDTPNLDQMAIEGIRFTNFHAQPVCGPSRAALLTGCYPQRIGQINNSRVGVGGGHPLIHPNEITLAHILKGVGYRTSMIGKWHLGLSNNNSPLDMGFDQFLGTPGSNDGPWVDLSELDFAPQVNQKSKSTEFPDVPLIRDRTVIEFPLHQTGLTTRYTDEALRIIHENSAHEEPFFLYLAHNAPHIPLHPSLKFKGKSRFGLYGDSVEEIDWNVGRILNLLKKEGLNDNTLVIYTSDNGPWLRPELVEKKLAGSAWPLRGGKVTSWEGGFRVPCLARMPGHISPGQVSDEFCTTLDLLPTLSQLIGEEIPTDRIIDGKDIWPIITSKAEARSPHETFYFYIGRNLQAVQSRDWKLILPRPELPELMNEYWASHFEPIKSPELYNLKTDISEKNDLASERPDLVEKLLAIAENAREDLGEGARIGQGERFWESNP